MPLKLTTTLSSQIQEQYPAYSLRTFETLPDPVASIRYRLRKSRERLYGHCFAYLIVGGTVGMISNLIVISGPTLAAFDFLTITGLLVASFLMFKRENDRLNEALGHMLQKQNAPATLTAGHGYDTSGVAGN